MEGESKGTVCVTGGTGFLASWLVMRLLQHGYSVNTTVRASDGKKDVSYLTSLPGASGRLNIFNADLARPDSFREAIEGCLGVFHVAHPIDFEDKETEETKTKRSIEATIGIIKACLETKTVKRVVYTSSASTVMFDDKVSDILNESSWSNIDFIRSLNTFGGSYFISKTLTEKATLDFAEEHNMEVVSVIPTWIHGPFLCPGCPGSVHSSLAMIIGNRGQLKYPPVIPFVHVHDVASAHIFLFESPDAQGRYICSAVEIEVQQLHEFLSTRYPEYKLSALDSLRRSRESKHVPLSSKRLLDTGFKYKYGVEEMFDGAIQCCKERGIL